MQIIDQIHRHPHPPISLDGNLSESLTANVTFLQEFLEGYNPHVSYTSEADPLESRIAEAAYAAEDVIESYVVDQILARSTTDQGGKISSVEFCQDLHKVIEEMDLIKMEIKKMKIKGVQIAKSKADGGSSRSISTSQTSSMAGLDDVLYEMLDRITGGGVNRQIFPIVGMGGLGKTTLARNIFTHPLVKEHFDVCGWSTISQVHNVKKILGEILDQVEKVDRGDLDEKEIKEKLYKHLIGRRYFIVMDDIWSVEAWDKVRTFFPENKNGSRIVITTRLSNLPCELNCSDSLSMKFLDEASTWNLFINTVFGDETCPPELDDIGRKIVEGCKGLPLSIVVVGGLLSKSGRTRGYWEAIEGNLNSIVNSEDEGSCLQILYTSYINLPEHIKPCFLYMSVTPEDDEMPVRFLIPLWVAEGFIKPIEGKSLEEAGEEYLEELVDRNLVLVERRNRYGKLKSCKIHDLLRDLCLRETQKNKFLCVLGEQSIPRNISCERRILIRLEYAESPLVESLESASLLRGLTMPLFNTLTSSGNNRLLRLISFLVSAEEQGNWEILIHLVNLRHFFFFVDGDSLPRIASSVSFLWNLQTLYMFGYGGEHYSLEIWKMPQLRHVITTCLTQSRTVLEGANCLSRPTTATGDIVVLESLHTLSQVRNLKFDEEVVERIPNIKTLKLTYDDGEEELGDWRLQNLHRLHKLQVLRLVGRLYDSQLMRELTLPHSLKKLTIKGTQLPWEEMASKIGCLPLLQVLKLKKDSFSGSEWETVEGRFATLKFLLIQKCDLENWITDDNTHFPRLEHLCLCNLKYLREIPSSIGYIPTLRSIKIEACSDSLVESARRIVEEQEELGNEDLELDVN